MPEQHLQKRISLLQATAINMIDMVGIGPFVVLSAVAAEMNGGWFLWAWIAGAVLSFVDACIWSELGAAYPLAGGSYNFLKVGYGPKWGKLMSFLLVWQTMIQAPLVITSASLGFAKYFAFIVPLNEIESKVVSGGLVVMIMVMLYRKIETIGKISVLLWMGVLLTIAIVIAAGVMHGNFTQPVKQMNEGADFSFAALAALGTASVSTVYSYLGYYNICHLGGEIINPQRNIPRSMFISITGIAILYLLMNISVASVLPMETIKKSNFVVSEFIHVLAGTKAATAVTVLILWVAFASIFSATLGYSRIPYAAAKDGAFFSVFAKLHPTKNFPYVSLLSLGIIAFIFSMLFNSVASVVKAILAMRILVQFIGQAIGLLLLHKAKRNQHFPWRMPLFPIPVVIAILIWIGIFYSTGALMLYGLGVITAGIIVYFIKAYFTKDWPFYKAETEEAQVEQLFSNNP